MLNDKQIMQRVKKMYKILIVEDDIALAEMMKRRLESWGHTVAVAKDFQDILGEFARTDPHLVLLDIMLPFYNGYHWCREIRKISNVPVMFISSAADNMNIVMAMNMGGDDFIPKPIDADVCMAKNTGHTAPQL
jgi:Response regulators consisting of a CheY-like receiver domain and a winged-helix DNA-binding domain